MKRFNPPFPHPQVLKLAFGLYSYLALSIAYERAGKNQITRPIRPDITFGFRVSSHLSWFISVE